jgi:hypothetical protein
MNIIQEKASRTDEVWKEIGLALAHKFFLRAKPETSDRKTSSLYQFKPFFKGYRVPKPGKHAKSVHAIPPVFVYRCFQINKKAALPKQTIQPRRLHLAHSYCFPVVRYSWIARAAFLPAPIARITVAAPVTMSPPAHTLSRVVLPVSGSATMVP